MWQNFKAQFREQIWNHEQMVKLRQKFAELDTTTQSYVLIGSFAAFVLVLLVSFFTLWGRSFAIKRDIADMEATIRYVQGAQAKIADLQDQANRQNADPLLEDFDAEAPLPALLEAAGSKSQIGKGNVEVKEASGGADVKLNHISLTQLVRVLYLIEQSGANAVVDHLTVDAKDDAQGYLWATLSVRKPAGGK